MLKREMEYPFILFDNFWSGTPPFCNIRRSSSSLTWIGHASNTFLLDDPKLSYLLFANGQLQSIAMKGNIGHAGSLFENLRRLEAYHLTKKMSNLSLVNLTIPSCDFSANCNQLNWLGFLFHCYCYLNFCGSS